MKIVLNEQQSKVMFQIFLPSLIRIAKQKKSSTRKEGSLNYENS